MLDGLKRLFGGGGSSPARSWEDVATWAQSTGRVFRAVGSEGFVVDGKLESTAWRLEWGPSQRPYITGHELRLRAELGLGADLQAMVMTRALQEQMEKAVFEQYVEGVQTRIDNQAPPEMRWLVMFPKLAGPDLGELRERFVALASLRPWLLSWLQGPLAGSLARHRLAQDQPLVLMIGRGRLMLRTALEEPEERELAAWVALFETAIGQARRAARESGDSVSPSTGSWSTSALPGSERHK